ncbi:hypothetical protein ED733_000279 [Metarhizium rileyi]|uniref:Rhodopsin domain-containing protein n=1 Tax=Metarhizium rileyi (strain RCEF 4871) TaxID=1649241 RepID=A0A5C6G3V9_METRR|nr:hypothetical protein ED733_000279 [Metarhizium rileyi]
MVSLPDPPPGLDLTETKVPALVSVFVIIWVLGTITLWSGGFMFVVTCYMVKHGFGLHIWAAPADAIRSYFLGLFVAEILYTLSLVFIKWSILAFYWRIFGAGRRIRPLLWTMFAVVCSWGIAVLLITIFQCLPVDAFWRRFDPIRPLEATSYACNVNQTHFFVGNAIPNMITDVLLLMTPIPLIWKLSLHREQKLAILSIFAIGAL